MHWKITMEASKRLAAQIQRISWRQSSWWNVVQIPHLLQPSIWRAIRQARITRPAKNSMTLLLITAVIIRSIQMWLQAQQITAQPSWKTTIPPLSSSSHKSSSCRESVYPSQLRTQIKCHLQLVQLVNKTASYSPAYSYAVQRIAKLHQSTIMRWFQFQIDKVMVHLNKMAIWQLSWDLRQVSSFPQLKAWLKLERISILVCQKESMAAWFLPSNILGNRWLSTPRHQWWKIWLTGNRRQMPQQLLPRKPRVESAKSEHQQINSNNSNNSSRLRIIWMFSLTTMIFKLSAKKLAWKLTKVLMILTIWKNCHCWNSQWPLREAIWLHARSVPLRMTLQPLTPRCHQRVLLASRKLTSNWSRNSLT